MTGSAGIGIITASDTASGYATIVDGNVIVITDSSLCVDDDCKLFFFTNNRFMNQGTVTQMAHWTTVVDINGDFAAGNICTGSGSIQVTCPTTTLT
jgi:hypothetical protein